ncbi:MAG: WG repeat-containing protein [Bacteroidetes bacterium]|nr:WG repeat-containing protein [Bacteroidota bacterium]
MIRKFPACISVIFLLAFAHCTSAQTKDVGSPRLLLPVKQGKLWGYADTMRNIVISPQFDMAYPFRKKIAVVEKGRKGYAIDSTGKILTPGFDQVFQLDDSILAVYVNEISDTLGGWGISTVTGKNILAPAYDQILRLSPDVFTYRKDTLWGAVNKNGVLLTKAVYDTITLVYGKYVELHTGKKIGLIGADGKRFLEDEFSIIYLPNENIIGAYHEKQNADHPKGWGAVDLSSREVIPFGFDSLFRIGYYFTGVKEKDSLGIYFTSEIGMPTPVHYKTILPLDLYWAKLIDFSGKCGLTDTTGKIIVPVLYNDVIIGGNGLWFAADAKNNWGIYSPDGKMIAPTSYSHIDPFRSRVAVFYSGNEQGLINDRGMVLVPPGIQQIIVRDLTVKVLHTDSSATYITLDENGNIFSKDNYDVFRVIKITGREAPVKLPVNSSSAGTTNGYTPRIDSLDWFMNNKTGLWGMRNTFTGDTILPAQFEYVTPAGNFLTLVAIKEEVPSVIVDERISYAMDRVGLVNDTTGKFTLKPEYASILTTDIGNKRFYGYVRATLTDGSMALVSTDGSARTFRCTYVENVANGYARFCTGGKWTIDDPGEMITNVFHFTTEQNLNQMRSFGIASTSKTFMEKNICIAGGKWGYLDSTGKIVIAPVYDGAKPSQKKTGIVKQNKKWGVLRMDNSSIIPCAYDVVSYLPADTNTMILAQNNGLRYGYIDRNGNIVIPADLKMSKPLGEGFIGFTRTGKWGVMNVRGEIICPENYNEILPFSEGKAAVRKGTKWGFIDTLGTEIIEPGFDKAGGFHNGIARANSNHKWGFIDVSGNFIVEPKYLQAGDFSVSSAPAKTRDGWGLIDKDGKWLQKPVWNKITLLDSLLPGFFVLRNEYVNGVCRADGKIIITPRYDQFKYLGEGRIAYLSGTAWGITDTSGKIITASIFDQLKSFSENLAAASYDSKWGYIRTNGKFAIEPQYMIAGKFQDHRAYTYTMDHKGQFIDTSGTVFFSIPRSCVLLGYSEGKYLLGRLNKKKEVEKMYFITRHGVLVNRCEYKEALPFQDGAARVREGMTWGLISYTGFYIVRPRYFMISPFDQGLARFQMHYTQGLFSIDGKEILPAEYDAIDYDAELKMVRFDKGNAMGYLFPDGRICWPEGE